MGTFQAMSWNQMLTWMKHLLEVYRSKVAMACKFATWGKVYRCQVLRRAG
jgi:hypothetical protein